MRLDNAIDLMRSIMLRYRLESDKPLSMLDLCAILLGIVNEAGEDFTYQYNTWYDHIDLMIWYAQKKEGWRVIWHRRTGHLRPSSGTWRRSIR